MTKVMGIRVPGVQVRGIRVLGLVCVLAVIVVGCGGGEGGKVGGREAQFAPIKEQKVALDAKRQEVADFEAQIAAAEEAGEEGGEGEATEGPSIEELQAGLNEAAAAAETMSEDFMTALINFLNSAEMIQGEAPTGANLEAIRLKSSEDMLIAQEYINRGGDYRRAMDVLDTALMLDPENPDLLAARAQAESDQYMTEERFSAVHKGMTEAEVQARLGTVNPSNLRDYPDKNIVAWFYRRADKGAVGVYFQEKNGKMLVYRLDFDAVKSGEEAES